MDYVNDVPRIMRELAVNLDCMANQMAAAAANGQYERAAWYAKLVGEITRAQRDLSRAAARADHVIRKNRHDFFSVTLD